MVPRAFRAAERVLFAIGVTCVSAWAAIALYGAASSRVALRAFDDLAAAPFPGSEAAQDQPADAAPEFSLWDPKRIAAYKQSLIDWTNPPLAVIGMPRLHLRVPIFEGTGDAQLNRGAGWIQGTARPGDPGNIGIAGHRDGFFRPLKDAITGDRIELRTNATTTVYVVDEITIVTPQDVHVLQPRARPSLTLVTCYPFYFVGSAPQRYIVHASLVEEPSTPSDVHDRAIAVKNAEDRQ
jgi:sortase A